MKITVGIPTYNAKEEKFREAIESVINQTLKPFEIIIVDDGSNPKFSLALPDTKKIPIRIITHKENLGIGAGRDTIVENASKESDHIAFLSSDDVWDEGFLEVMTKASEQNPEKILYSNYYFINNKGNIINKTQFINYKDHEDFCISAWSTAEKNNMFVNFSTTFFPKKVFEKVQFDKNLRYCEDLDFLLKSMKHFEYYFVKDYLLKYRIEDNTTSRVIDKIPEQNEMIRKNCREYWKNG